MDFCSICLVQYDRTTGMQNKSEEWQQHNIQKIIEKHLWWWYRKPCTDFSSLWICQSCWEHLWTFHRFYLRVENQHLRYEHMISKSYKMLKEFPTLPKSRKRAINMEDDNPLKEFLVPLDSLSDAALLQKNVKSENVPNATFEIVAKDHMDCGNQDECDAVKLKECSSETLKRRNTVLRNAYKGIQKSACKSPNESDNHKKRLNSQCLSTAQIVKNYDEFIAANFEIFCSLCADHVRLVDFQTLKSHFLHHHREDKPFVTCCGMTIHKRAILVDHLRTHKDPESFKCQLCSKSLPNRLSLRRHLEWHDKTNKPQFECNECHKIFFTKASFDNHKFSHVPENGKHIPCSECDKKFASDSLRLRHFNASHLKKYAKVCETCGKQFSNRECFQRHLAEHTGATTAPIHCDICGMQITTLYGLNRHKKLRHTEESTKAVQCPFCSKLKPNAVALRNHIEYVHQQRKHVCSLCDKAFRRPFDLKEHINTHTGETPYTCAHCSRTFRRHNKLYMHMKNHHPKEWVGGTRKTTASRLLEENEKKL